MNARLSRLEMDLLKARALDVSIAEVALRHGIPIRGRHYAGPCLCGGTKRFWIDTDSGLWGCHDCTPKASDNIGLERFLSGVGFVEACLIITDEKRERPQVPPTASTEEKKAREAKQHQKAKRFWDNREPIEGTAAAKYYRGPRGITCPLPPTLGFLPASVSGYRHHAVIAAVAMPEEIEPGILAAPVLSAETASVHLTFIRADGSDKAYTKEQEAERKRRNPPQGGNKIFVGRTGNAPIAIAPPNNSELAITEGSEDSLSAFEACKLGAWAAGGAWRLPVIAKQVPIDRVKRITIFAHPEEAGQRGARACADVLVDRGFDVYVDGLLPMTT